jgi:prepilin-type N-terminal cleavage/methylation domain-containing protein
MKSRKKSRKSFEQGFSLIELVVVIASLAIVAGVLVPRVSSQMASARDARRMQAIETVRQAVERYHEEKGEYPAPNQNASYGGWDVSHDGDFVRALRDAGYLEQDLVDPVNDETYHYRYFVYGPGSYGCAGGTPYYVLGIRNFESADFAARSAGSFQCPSRNWASEFAFVTGGGTPAAE